MLPYSTCKWSSFVGLTGTMLMKSFVSTLSAEDVLAVKMALVSYTHTCWTHKCVNLT